MKTDTKVDFTATTIIFILVFFIVYSFISKIDLDLMTIPISLIIATLFTALEKD